jgi:hypothetical protein
MVYMLFGWYKECQGGAFDFIGAYASRDEAKEAGLSHELVRETRMGNGIHLAEWNGATLMVTDWLNIPGTEQAESDELVWMDLL